MISVNEQARQVLDAIRSNAVAQMPEVPPGAEPALRLVIKPDSEIGLVLDQPRSGDQVIEHDDHAVLVVDEGVGQQLSGYAIEVEQTSVGEQLAIKRLADGEA